MSHYGQLRDYVAAFLGVAATLAFAYAWKSVDIVVGGLAAVGMTVAVAIVVYEHFFHRAPGYAVHAHTGVAIEGIGPSRGARKHN